MLSPLFQPRMLGSIALSNAIVMAPMTRDRASARDVPGDLMVEYYRQRASAGGRGSAGQQIAGCAVNAAC